MKTRFRIAILLASISLPLLGQDVWFTAQSTGVLAAAGATATLQRGSGANAGTGKAIILDTIMVECPAACTITQAQNGTAATATAVVPTGVSPNSAMRAEALFYSASNVGVGQAVGGRITCSAACMVVIDVSKIELLTGNSNFNYSTTISAVTGTYSITYQWRER